MSVQDELSQFRPEEVTIPVKVLDSVLINIGRAKNPTISYYPNDELKMAREALEVSTKHASEAFNLLKEFAVR